MMTYRQYVALCDALEAGQTVPFDQLLDALGRYPLNAQETCVVRALARYGDEAALAEWERRPESEPDWYGRATINP